MSTYPRTTFAEVAAVSRLFVVSKPYKRADRAARPWCVEYRDPLTDKRKKRCFATEKDAWAFYNRVTDDREGLRCGSLTRRQVMVGAAGLTQIAEAKEKYIEHHRAKGRSHSIITNAESVIGRLIAATNWTRVKDIMPGPCEIWLAPFSPNCRVAYLRIIRAWTRWLVKADILPADPLDRLEPPKETERERKRALTDDELNRLVTCPDIDMYRRLWYWLSARTGLRHAEIMRLHWRHVNFETATLNLPKEITKTNRAANLPVPASLMQSLRENQQHPEAKIVPNVWRIASRVWKHDLARAGIAFETAAGKALASSLRKTFCTHLARKGVDLRTAQRLMRHSNVNLTSKTYTEVLPSEMREAVEKLA